MGQGNRSDSIIALTAEQLVPRRRSDIRRLRQSSPIFDEICADFELIAGMLRDGRSEDAALIETRDGLKAEICDILTNGTKDS